MTYSQPTLATLRSAVRRDVRDPSSAAFQDPELNDLINWGIVEVSRIYPIAGMEYVSVTRDVDTQVIDRLYQNIGSSTISRMEVWSNGVYRESVPPMGDESNSGWDLFGSNLIIPSWVALDDTTDALVLYGYQTRDTLTNDSDVLNSDAEAEMGVRLYATMRGYQRLQNDRALFQQWLAIPGNKDISPTQLDGMANTYLADWNRHRQHIRLLRR